MTKLDTDRVLASFAMLRDTVGHLEDQHSTSLTELAYALRMTTAYFEAIAASVEPLIGEAAVEEYNKICDEAERLGIAFGEAQHAQTVALESAEYLSVDPHEEENPFAEGSARLQEALHGQMQPQKKTPKPPLN